METKERPSLDPAADALRRLERRVARLEAHFHFPTLPENEPGAAASPEVPPEEAEDLEFAIGERYLARAGVFALIIGIAFLVTYLYGLLPPWLSSLTAFLLAAITFVLGGLSGRYYPHVRLPLLSGGLLLLFYAALRLWTFTDRPLIADRGVGLAVLGAAVALQAVISVRARSQLLGALTLLCGLAAGLLADGVHSTLTALVLTSALAAYLRLRHDWDAAAVLACLAAYLAHLIWLLGNPLLGHPLALRAEALQGLPYLYATSLLFAGANLFRSRLLARETSNILLSFINAAGFCLCLLLAAGTAPGGGLAPQGLLAAAFLLTVAIVYRLGRSSLYAASFYALGGFLALSAAILARFQEADRFIFLAWQSLLVIATAIWFRSRIITVGNLGIFLGLYLLHVLTAKEASAWVNLNQALVAILSARLLNAARGQLDFETEILRNSYLAATFLLVPYGLSLAVPDRFVSVSWMGASVLYFGLSFILRNKKYRWMGILNFLLVVGRVFVVDLAYLDILYRVLSFVALGAVLLLVSVAYARRSRASQAPPGAGGRTP